MAKNTREELVEEGILLQGPEAPRDASKKATSSNSAPDRPWLKVYSDGTISLPDGFLS